MSIGIVTTVYGPKYHGFVLEWAEAILDLNREPDWVTIAHDGIPDDIRNKLVKWLDPVFVTDPVPHRFHPQVHVNAAIAVTFTDWIIKADIDDLLLPHALDGWEEMTADVINFGYSINNQYHVSWPVTAEEVMQRKSNRLGSCSPFRRWVWETNHFSDMLYDDWAFWIKAAEAGAVFNATQRVDYVYRVHPDQMTRRHDNQQAFNEIQAL